MAGGPSTPELVAAVGRAGGLGVLAAGYLDAERMGAEIDATRGLCPGPFGVNLFVTDPADSWAAVAGRDGSVEAYAEALRPWAERLGASLPEHPAFTDNDHSAKLELLCTLGVPVVSFTFGCPEPAVVRALHEAGSAVSVGVTTVADAVAAVEAGADWLCVQGPEAGGHRFTWAIGAEPPRTPLPGLVRAVRAELPRTELVAAGGLCTPEAVAEVLAAGATGVQLGTALLAAREAGTSAPHRAALGDPRYTATRVTRCFSGRPARGLANAFLEEFDPIAPPAYPQVNALTGPLRAAGAKAGDTEVLALWAGTEWERARPLAGRPAEEIVAGLWDAAQR